MPLFSPSTSQSNYAAVPVVSADALIAINRTTYGQANAAWRTVLDFTYLPATLFRLTGLGFSSESGQTVTIQIDEGTTGVAPLSAAGDDLVVGFNGGAVAELSTGWISIDGAQTGQKKYYVLLKGSNTTVDITLRYLLIEWRVV